MVPIPVKTIQKIFVSLLCDRCKTTTLYVQKCMQIYSALKCLYLPLTAMARSEFFYESLSAHDKVSLLSLQSYPSWNHQQTERHGNTHRHYVAQCVLRKQICSGAQKWIKLIRNIKEETEKQKGNQRKIVSTRNMTTLLKIREYTRLMANCYLMVISKKATCVLIRNRLTLVVLF